MANQRVRIYIKKAIVVSHLQPSQLQMLKLGNIGLASRKDEIGRGRNVFGGQARPLTKRYAISKSRYTSRTQGKGRNIRDLSLTGNMLKEWLIRVVSTTQADATFSTRDGRSKAAANNAIEEFIGWSPKNASDVIKGGQTVLAEMSRGLIIERFLNG